MGFLPAETRVLLEEVGGILDKTSSMTMERTSQPHNRRQERDSMRGRHDGLWTARVVGV